MSELEKAAHKHFVPIITPKTKGIIYPEGESWVLAIGWIYKTGDWKKPLGRFQNVEQAVAAAKVFGFARISVRHIYKPKIWTEMELLHEKDWCQRYSDNRAQGPIPPHRRVIQYGISP